MTTNYWRIKCFAVSLILALVTAGCATSPLKQAAGAGNTEMVKNLLGQGQNINQTDGFPIDFTPLMSAASNGHTDTVNLLVSKGADINAETSMGYTALGLAAMEEKTDTVKLLINKGADRSKAIGGLKLADRQFGGSNRVIQRAIQVLEGYR